MKGMKIKLSRFLIVNLICVTFLSIGFNKNVTSAISLLKPINLTERFEKFDNKEEFKNYYRNEIELRTDNERQREIVLNNIYKVQDYLRYLEIDIKLIDRDEMEEIAEAHNVSHFNGLYNVDSNELYLVGYDTDTSIHEIGHAIYYQILTDFERSNINSLFETEKNGLIDSYGTTSKEEFFAVAFTEYIYSEDTLKENCTETYNFFKMLEEKVK